MVVLENMVVLVYKEIETNRTFMLVPVNLIVIFLRDTRPPSLI